MQVDGPATGMEQVDCVQLDEIVLEQSGVQSVTSASGGGGGASPRGGPGPSPREAPLGKNGRNGKAAAQEWALGAMPVQPGEATHIPGGLCAHVLRGPCLPELGVACLAVPCAGLGKQSGRFGIGEGHMKPKDSPRGYLDISEVSSPFSLHTQVPLQTMKRTTARYPGCGRWVARAEVLLRRRWGSGRTSGARAGPGQPRMATSSKLISSTSSEPRLGPRGRVQRVFSVKSPFH